MEAVLISAGKSSRMGQDKALMISNGELWGISIIRKLLLVCEKVIVVLGHHKNEIESALVSNLTDIELKSTLFVENINHENGMFSSIQFGFSFVKKGQASFFHVIDQPFISKELYINLNKKWSQIIENGLDYHYIQPTYNNKKGHPIIFSPNSINKIVEADSNSNLKIVMDSLINGDYLITDDSTILHNINSKDELNKEFR
ncbi:NTP transferase domain-containing protein [bacterium]|nr:NTP transferase domain-containing protein [bacterium]